MTDGEDLRPVRRPVVVTAILLVAVSVMLVALRSWLDRPTVEVDIAGAASVAAEARPIEPAFESEPVVEPVVAVRPAPEQIGVPVLVVTPTDPIAVIVLPARVASSDPEAATVTEAVRQSTLRALSTMRSIRVIEVSAAELAAIVPRNAGPLGDDNVVYLAVTRRHDARVVAEISEQTAPQNLFWSLSLLVRRPNGGGGNGGNVARNGNPRMGDDIESLGIRYADRIVSDADRVARESGPVTLSGAVAPNATPAAEARNVFLDTFRPEAERLRMLSQLLNGPPDVAVIAAAVDLATRSPSAATRRSVGPCSGGAHTTPRSRSP